MKTLILTDDQGYFPLGVYPAHGAHFIQAPMAVCSTDARGYYSGTFVAAPITVKQVTNVPAPGVPTATPDIGTPITGVSTDNKGYSLWSGKFVGAPIAVYLT